MIVKSEKYWAELLEQYKLGNISEADRFELEKRALDDPFLFDALEGFSTVSQVSTREKETKSKLLTLPRMAAAASLVFLVAMIFLLKNNNTPETASDQSIAMVLDQDSKKTEETQSSIDNEEKETPTQENAEDEIISEPTIQKKKSPSSNTSVSPPTNQQPPIADNISTKPKPASPTTVEMDIEDSHHMEDLEEIIETGDVIVDADNGGSNSKITPQRADSSFKRTKSKIENSGSEATADNNATPEIQTAKKEEKEGPASTFYIVEPAIGIKDFEEFVKESIDNRGLRKESPHEVTIEFDIDKNGELSNFLHIYNGCSECGGYAIHLLSTSGVWKTNPKGQEGRARYTLMF